MLYGLEVIHLSENMVRSLEDAHRQHSKVVQGLPANIPRPASLASLGLLSNESYIDMYKMLFMWKILCLRSTNIYRRVLLYLLEVYLNVSQSPKMIGPVISMLQCIGKYKLKDVLQQHLRQGSFGEISCWKTFTKKIIWENERFKWKASCMLYKELDIYLESIKDIKMSCWWTVARYKPQATKNISSVLAVLFGGQPRGLQNNIAGTSCKLWHMAVRETPQHVLFMCPGLEAQREALWHDVIRTMPNALTSDITRLN